VSAVEDFKRVPPREAKLGERLIAVSYQNGKSGVISNVCNHVGGPLGRVNSKASRSKCCRESASSDSRVAAQAFAASPNDSELCRCD
jgi:hypothetical protein